MAYVGSNSPAQDILGNNPRYFYALRRTDEGTLYFVRTDQLVDNSDSIQINAPGDVNNDFTDFSVGNDFFEGRDVYHNLVYPNLNYEQMRWDDKSVYYYINSNGELVARIGQAYAYTQQDNLGAA
jgi:hypothetical protein